MQSVEFGEPMTTRAYLLQIELNCPPSSEQLPTLKSVTPFEMSLGIPPGCHFLELPFQKGTRFQQFPCLIC